jgi:hypothetical protein
LTDSQGRGSWLIDARHLPAGLFLFLPTVLFRFSIYDQVVIVIDLLHVGLMKINVDRDNTRLIFVQSGQDFSAR